MEEIRNSVFIANLKNSNIYNKITNIFFKKPKITPTNIDNNIIIADNDDDHHIKSYIKCLFHELRNPLNNILMGIDYLDDEQDIEKKEVIKNIKSACEFMNLTLNGFLLIQNNKIDYDNLSLVFAPFNIVGLLHKIEYLLYFNIIEKKIKINYNIKNLKSTWLIGDSSKLEQAFLNLLLNIIKYSNSETIIHIDIYNTNNVVQINIIDQNVYISEDIKRILFQKYDITEYLKKKNNVSFNSIGLGLFLTKKILVLHNSSFEYENIYPIGNKFIIKLNLNICKDFSKEFKEFTKELTLTKEELSKKNGETDNVAFKNKSRFNNNIFFKNNLEKIISEKVISEKVISEKVISEKVISEKVISKENRKRSVSVSIDMQNAIGNRSEKISSKENRKRSISISINMQNPSEVRSEKVKLEILIVDDSDLTRKLLIKLCKNIFDVSFCEACDGLEAVKTVYEKLNNIKLIFIDNIMPNLTGPVATKIIRTLGYNNLIIGVTGNGSFDDINDFLLQGCDYVFIKPFTKQKLNMIYDLINKNGYKRKDNYKLVINDDVLYWESN